MNRAAHFEISSWFVDVATGGNELLNSGSCSTPLRPSLLRTSAGVSPALALSASGASRRRSKKLCYRPGGNAHAMVPVWTRPVHICEMEQSSIECFHCRALIDEVG